MSVGIAHTGWILDTLRINGPVVTSLARQLALTKSIVYPPVVHIDSGIQNGNPNLRSRRGGWLLLKAKVPSLDTEHIVITRTLELFHILEKLSRFLRVSSIKVSLASLVMRCGFQCQTLSLPLITLDIVKRPNNRRFVTYFHPFLSSWTRIG